MTVRDGSAYLEQAVGSVLRQTFRNIQIIVIDDASQDRTSEILASVQDSRVEVVRSNVPLGVAQAKTLGIERAAGEYIAMMDADDVALPARFAVQKNYLDKRPETAIVGSNVVVVRADGSRSGARMLPERHLGILWRLLVGTPFVHPTIMIRRECLDAFHYRQGFEYSQDYDLWSRLLRVERGANIRQPLLLYRQHPGQHSREDRESQLVEHEHIAASVIRRQLPELDLPPATVSRMCRFMTGVARDDPAMDELGIVFLQMARAFLAKYAGCAGSKDVLQDVAVTIARRFAPHARTAAARTVFRELVRQDPRAPARCASVVVSAANFRVRSLRAVRGVVKNSKQDSLRTCA